MNAYELADELQELDSKLHLINLFKSADMLRQQADRIAELEKEKEGLLDNRSYLLGYADGKQSQIKQCKDCGEINPAQIHTCSPQIKELSDEENNLKWWISSFEHLKGLGGGISDEMETKLKEMKAILKKASEK